MRRRRLLRDLLEEALTEGSNIFIFLRMHGYGEALQALAFLNSVDGGSVGYLTVSECLIETDVRMVTMCVAA